jgi:OmpA-OmpF porin, OOP family
MQISFKVLAATLILCAMVSPVRAENFYAAIDYGQSNLSDICASNPPGVNGCQNTGILFRVAVGMQLAPMWAVEASYGDLGGASIGAGAGLSGTWKGNGLQVSGIGAFPIANQFSIIGKLGIVRADLEVAGFYPGTGFDFTNTTTNVAYGIGVQYDMRKVAIRAQYENLGTIGDANTTGTTKATLLSFGLLYRLF